MKPFFLLTICLCFSLMVQAQVSKTVNVTAGNLMNLLTAEELNTVNTLTLTGTMDARDFRTIRVEMPVLAELDLTGVTIAGFLDMGTSVPRYYPENTIPGGDGPNFGKFSLYDKTSLISIFLPPSLTTIEDGAFIGCSGLTSLVIPSSVTFIGYGAFQNCSKLSSCILPSSLIYIGSNAFRSCSSLTSIELPEGITFIEGTFWGCTSLRTISIPSSILTIGHGTFNGCSELTDIEIPSSVTTIDSEAFRGCSALTSILIPSSVTKIGSSAFRECSGLKSVNIPPSVTSIGAMAFSECINLQSIYSYPVHPINIGDGSDGKVFGSVDKMLCILYVPFGSKELYEQAQQWNEFTNIVEMPGSKQHFIPVWSGNGYDLMNFHTYSAKINGVDLHKGDAIGIFDGAVCVGTGILTKVLNENNILDIKVSRDDPATPEIDGYISGHRATFKIWDASEQLECSAVKISYNSGDNIFASGASTFYHIEGFTSTTQEIALKEGWNIFSLNVTPENKNMVEIIQSLIFTHSFVQVQNESGKVIGYLPGTSAFVNNIGNWSPTEGYKIKLNAPALFSTTGIPIFQPVQINLLSGWNIIGYPVSIPMDPMVLFNDLINSNHLIKVQDETGAAIEIIPGSTGWINNIGNLTPGKGYKVRVVVNDILTIYPSSRKSDRVLKPIVKSSLPEFYKPIWKGNGLDHMNIYLSETSGTSSLLKNGSEIGIFDGSICVGAGVIKIKKDEFNSFVVSADDPATPETDGFITGHPIHLRIWDPSTKKEISDMEWGFYPGSNLKFEPMGTASIHINSIFPGLDNQIEGATFLGNNYPNPFNGQTTIPFVIAKETAVDISIYNIYGKKIITLVHGNYQPGSYTTNWGIQTKDQGEIKPGIYICKMVASDLELNKLIVVR